jgi:hypothetical protein
MKALAVLVLRFKEPQAERWRVPLNIRLRGIEIPVGLVLITVVLFLLAGINLLTKTTATVSGAAFTVIFFAAFSLSQARSIRQPRRPTEIRRRRRNLRAILEGNSEAIYQALLKSLKKGNPKVFTALADRG